MYSLRQDGATTRSDQLGPVKGYSATATQTAKEFFGATDTQA